MHVSRLALRFLLLLLLGLPVLSQAATLSSQVDRTTLSGDETLSLTVTYDGDLDDADIDTGQLEQQFVIEGRNRSSQITMVNGQMNSTATWYFQLRPKRSGKLLVPSFRIGNDFSEAIEVTVTGTPTSVNQDGRRVYTEVAIDKPTARVQEQVIVSWRLVSELNISKPAMDIPDIPNVLVYDLGARQYQRSSPEGRTERVLEQRMAFFPQQSGRFVIPEMRFNFALGTPRRFSSGLVHMGYEKRYIKTVEQILEVTPAPTNGPGPWLPARTLDLAQSFEGLGPGNTATVGETLTRTLTLTAKGLLAEQLPSLEQPTPGFKAYADKPAFQNRADVDSVFGERTDKITLIPTQPGTLTLPAVELSWYNTSLSQWEKASLPAQTIEIRPAPGQATQAATDPGNQAAPPVTPAAPDHAAAAEPAPSDTPFSFQLLVAALGLCLLLVAGLLWRILQLQQKLGQQAAAGAARVDASTSAPRGPDDRVLSQVAQAGDPAQFARTVLAWAQARFAAPAPSSLPALAAQIEDADLRAGLQALDAALYSQAAPLPDLATLAERLQKWQPPQATRTSRQSARAGTVLEELYR